MRSADELWELLREAYSMPYGAAQIAMVDQLLRQVDASGDPELAYTARMIGTTAYVYGGEPAKAFVTFAWCLSDFDKNPAPYHARMEHNLLWDFKTMVSALLKFPEVPLDRTYAVLDDMEHRYREGGHSMQAVYKRRYLVAEHVGLTDEADAWYERWVTAPRDDLSDCIGCDPSDRAAYLAFRGRYDDVVELAGPVLAGELTCTEQPQTILNHLMEPYLRTGRLEEAADAHRRAYRLQRDKLADLSDLGRHIAFCARTDNEHRGLELLQRHVDWLETAPSPAAEMRFAADARVLLWRLIALGHGDTTIRLRHRGDVTAIVLAGEMEQRATALARRFDARNGTDAQSRRIADQLDAQPFDVALPLSATARRGPAPRPAAAAEPAPHVPADADPETLLDLAEEHEREDRDAAVAATLEALDVQVPEPTTLEPLLEARRATLIGGLLWETDHAAAAQAWQRAAKLFADAGDEGAASSVRGRLGILRCFAGEPDEGRALIEADVAWQQEHGDARRQASAWSRLAQLHFLQDRVDEANEHQDRADQAAAETGDARLIALYAMRRAQNRFRADRTAEAVAAVDEALAFYRTHGPADRRAVAALLRGQVTDDPTDAVAAFTETLDTGEPDPALTARLGRGHALMQLGRAAEAVPDLVEAVALCAELGLDDGGAFSRLDLANAYRLAGRAVEAAEVAEEALAGFVRLGREDAANDARLLLAGVYRQLDDPNGALKLYHELLDRLAGNPAGLGQVGEQAGQLLFQLDRDAEAAETFGTAGAHLREDGDLLGELRLLRRRLIALHYADQVAQAEELLRLAADRYAELPTELAEQPAAIWGRAMLGFEAGRLLMSRGRYAEAIPHLADGPTRLRAVGAVDDADQVAGMYAEALLRSGSPADAEALLRPLLAGMSADAAARATAATVLAEALDALGRDDEAAALRETEGLNDR